MAWLLLLSTGIHACNRWLARACSWLLLLMVLGQFGSVVARYVFSTGSIRLQESIVYMHGVLFLLAAAGTMANDAHVRVDVIYRSASKPFQAMVDTLGAFVLALPVCLLIFIDSLDYVRLSWAVQEGSREVSGLPFVYILKSVILVFAISLGAQSFANGIQALAHWRATRWRATRGRATRQQP